MEAKTGKGGFRVTAWEDATRHIRPSTIIYGADAAGVGPRLITYNQNNKPTVITYNGQRS